MLSSNEAEQEIIQKIRFIEDFKFLPRRILTTLKDSIIQHQNLSEIQKNKLKKLLPLTELTDFDKAEMFLCYIGSKEESAPDSLIQLLDPQRPYHEQIYGEDYKKNVRRKFKQSCKEIAKHALPRVRAKLATKELICFCLKSENLLLDLVTLSPLYLQCRFARGLITKNRAKKFSKSKKDHLAAKQFFTKLNSAMNGKINTGRKYSYWKIDNVFTEVLGCINTAKKMKSRSRRLEYLKVVCSYWNLTDAAVPIIMNSLDRPNEATLDVLIMNNYLKDASTWRNFIKPAMDKVKKEYPYVALADPLVHKVIDDVAAHPDISLKYPYWHLLENFSFSAPAKGKPSKKHSISPPET